MKKLLSLALSASLLAAAAVPAAAVYQDVPSGSALAGEVQKAVDYGLMNGYSTEDFGYADPMTRAQFVTVLDRMLLPQGNDETLVGHITASMQVDYQSVKAYYSSIDAAAEHDWVDTDKPFRPSDPITRGEMAEILVRALGLKGAAKLADSASTLPFTDVAEGRGYIAVAYAIGMTKGTSDTTFSPDATATRAQAAACWCGSMKSWARKQTGSMASTPSLLTASSTMLRIWTPSAQAGATWSGMGPPLHWRPPPQAETYTISLTVTKASPTLWTQAARL